jgi:hypothetical protein
MHIHNYYIFLCYIFYWNCLHCLHFCLFEQGSAVAETSDELAARVEPSYELD